MPRLVLIGAASAQFGFHLCGDVLRSQILAGSTLVLHDINAPALESVASQVKNFVREKNLPFEIEATTDRKKALAAADYVVISIEVGDRFKLWDIDWKLPLQFGFSQVYGECGGPGGLFHALRVIPPILEICADIEKLCPQAVVFNLTNPMTYVCLAVTRQHPDLKFFGLCHEVASLGRYLPVLCDLPLEEIFFRAGGMNHFSVLVEVRDGQGRDLYPRVLEKAREFFTREPGEAKRLLQFMGEKTGTASRSFEERGLWQLFLEEYRLLPITTDSHFGEYLGWAASLVDHQGIEEFYQAYRRFCREYRPRLSLEFSGERVVPIIEALLEKKRAEEWAVNLPNEGLIDNLPRDMVVEVPAVIEKGQLRGVALGRLPEGFGALLQIRAAACSLGVEAARQGSRTLAKQALLADPTCRDARCVGPLLDAVIELQRPYLDYLR